MSEEDIEVSRAPVRLVVGLGNPGPEYEGTRHNVGFQVVERVAREREVLFRSARHLEGYRGPRSFQWAALEEPPAWLVKPETFMNHSGEVVAPLLHFLDEAFPSRGQPPGAATEDPSPASRLLIVYDDLDLDLGRLRLRSIIEHLGTKQIPRLRVGIGRPGTDAARYVLQPFPEDERVEIDISLAEASEAVMAWLESGDIAACMARFHSRWNQDS